ncbi:hypothetical protein [Terribacillus saccharophilus]|uniref:Uncharacterized protein n=1 Tax=Terribacillus saccharophilus TaxID=361277 RepID=A0A075LL58_9BACI|nr:hypothetical protein [Terribacillus goriensis]AIF67505.1 hypothetical protein GZ22_13255 [Terribacillus goriensis]
MNRTIVGVSLLFISALLTVGKMISTAMLTIAEFLALGELNWEEMMDGKTPNEIDVAIIGCLILGALILILNELYGEK